jgi:dihydrofolate reductase
MTKKVIVIGAVSINGVYGEGNGMLWHIPEDFKHFKELTTEWTVIMGRGTWESLPPKFRPLPHRENIVITNTPNYKAEGATVFASIEQAVMSARTDKVFCIGGASIWYHAMHIADEAWITFIKKEYPITPGVTHCAPELLNPPSKWPSFSFNEMKVEKDALGTIPGFSIVHWVSKKK